MRLLNSRKDGNNETTGWDSDNRGCVINGVYSVATVGGATMTDKLTDAEINERLAGLMGWENVGK